eukprot:CFRG2268T1
MPNASNAYIHRGSVVSSHGDTQAEIPESESKVTLDKGFNSVATPELNVTEVSDDLMSQSSREVALRNKTQLILTLMLGQFLSACILCTGITSSYLATDGVDLPQFQGLVTYVSIAIIWVPIALFTNDGWSGLKYRIGKWGWIKYMILGLIDVEANFMIVKAYQYASITSVQLLDNFVVPCVMVLSIVFLNVTFKLWHYVGATVAVVGIVSLVLRDYFANGDSEAANPVLGDLLVVASAFLYAVSNVAQEFLVKGEVPVAEWLAMISIFGSIIACIQFFIVEGPSKVQEVEWTGQVYGYFAGFIASMILFYSCVPLLIRRSSATVLNLSLLTADFYSIFAGVFLFDVVFSFVYAICFVLSVSGLIIYNLVPEPVVTGTRKILRKTLGVKMPLDFEETRDTGLPVSK